MRRCAGCGGVLGVDCFNESECISITNSQSQNLEYRVQVLEETVFKLLEMLKKHNINFEEIREIPKKVEYRQDYYDDLPF